MTLCQTFVFLLPIVAGWAGWGSWRNISFTASRTGEEMLSSCWISISRKSPLLWERDLGQHLPGCNSLLNYNIPPPSSLLSSLATSQPICCYHHTISSPPMLRGRLYVSLYWARRLKADDYVNVIDIFPSLYLAIVFILKIKSNQTWQDKIYIPSVSL